MKPAQKAECWGEHGNAVTPAPQVLQAYYSLMDAYVPPGVLVNHRWELLHVFGSAGEHLRLPNGPFNRNLLSMLPAPWSDALKHIVLELGEDPTSLNGQVKSIPIAGDSNGASLTLKRMDDGSQDPVFHVLFYQAEPGTESSETAGASPNITLPEVAIGSSPESKNAPGHNSNNPPKNQHHRISTTISPHREQNRLEATLQHFEQATDAVLIEDENGNIQGWNQAATMLFGYSAEEIKGKHSSIILPPGKVAEQNAIRVLVKSGLPLSNVETERVSKSGELLDVTMSVTPIMKDHAGIAHFLFVIRDVSETKLIAQKLAETANLEYQRVLAGGIAHQFNNLLTGVLANASFLQSEHGMDPDLLEPIAEIKDAAKKASELCTKMLSYARKVSYSKKPIDLKKLTLEAVDSVKFSQNENIGLDVIAREDCYCIEADPTYVRQALLTLIFNAVEALEEEKGLIQIYLEKVDIEPNPTLKHSVTKPSLNPGPHVVFVITDTGPGIKPEHIHRIFDPFFSTKFMGRGLGLAAACGIVRDHQGDFEVVSTEGKGTTVKMFLPLREGGKD